LNGTPQLLIPHWNSRGGFQTFTNVAGAECCSGAFDPRASGTSYYYSGSAPGSIRMRAWYGSLIAGWTGENGLTYMRNRYYDSRSGQFTQTDPIGIAGGRNVTGFAAGDPINFSDPFGLNPTNPEVDPDPCEASSFDQVACAESGGGNGPVSLPGVTIVGSPSGGGVGFGGAQANGFFFIGVQGSFFGTGGGSAAFGVYAGSGAGGVYYRGGVGVGADISVGVEGGIASSSEFEGHSHTFCGGITAISVCSSDTTGLSFGWSAGTLFVSGHAEDNYTHSVELWKPFTTAITTLDRYLWQGNFPWGTKIW
jgi:RHS repeat-associated protein